MHRRLNNRGRGLLGEVGGVGPQLGRGRLELGLLMPRNPPGQGQEEHEVSKQGQDKSAHTDLGLGRQKKVLVLEGRVHCKKQGAGLDYILLTCTDKPTRLTPWRCKPSKTLITSS